MAKLLEPDLSTRLVRITTAFNDHLYSCANEPSLGMYRIQEHVTLTVPKLVEQQRQLRESGQRVEGTCYDLEYGSKTLEDMAGITQFGKIRDDLLKAIQLKKKLDEVEMKKRASHMQQPAVTASLHQPPPQPSLPPPPPPPLSLPPTLSKTTPTNQPLPPTPPSDRNNYITGSNNSNREVAVEDQDLGNDPDSDIELSPKSFD